jgi:hypothetical protein
MAALVASTAIGALLLWAIIAIIAIVPNPPDVALYAGITGVLLLSIAPPSVGYYISMWTVDPGRAPVRTHVRRIIFVGLAIELAGSAALCAFAIAVGLDVRLTAAIIAGSLVLLGLGIVVGDRSRRRELANRQEPVLWSPFSRSQLARIYRRIAVIFAVGLIVGFALMAWLSAAEGGATGEYLAFVIALASLAASFGTLGPVFTLRPYFVKMQPDVAQDNNAIAKAVSRGKSADLSGDQRLIAVRYASLMTVHLPFIALQQVLLWVAMGLIQLNIAVSGGGEGGFSRILAYIFLALIIVMVVFTSMTLRRIRAYLAAHPDDVAAALAEDELVREAQQSAGD